jgi:hypothetical protein
MGQQYPMQYNVNGNSGSYNQLTPQYPQSNGPYFQPTSTQYRTRGSVQPAPMMPNWNVPTYGNQNVSLY